MDINLLEICFPRHICKAGQVDFRPCIPWTGLGDADAADLSSPPEVQHRPILNLAFKSCFQPEPRKDKR